MIYIIHGENSVKSRDLTIAISQKIGQKSRKEFTIEDTTPEDLLIACASTHLFEGSVFVVLDVTKAGRMNMEPFLSVAQKVPADSVLVIYSSKELPKTNLFMKSVGALKARVFLNTAVPASNVFAFTDSVINGNRQMSYRELARLEAADEDPIGVFSMLIYSFRNVAICKFNAPLVSKMAPFIKTKAMRQAESYTQESLGGLYKDLYELDKGCKTGGIPQSILLTLAVEKIFSARIQS